MKESEVFRDPSCIRSGLGALLQAWDVLSDAVSMQEITAPCAGSLREHLPSDLVAEVLIWRALCFLAVNTDGFPSLRALSLQQHIRFQLEQVK